MKKILFGLLFALLTSVSFANQMTLFKGSSGDNWAAFEQDLKKEGLLKDGAFPTDVLAQIAYGYAKEQKLPQGALEEKEFKKLFLLANNFSEIISVIEFRKLGQTGKIVLPDLVARTATMGTEAPATPVAQAPVVPAVTAPVYGGTFPASADVKQAMAIANMEGQVKALQEEVAKSGSNQKEVKALTARLSDFGKQLKSLNDGQSGFATKAEVAAANQALTNFKNEVGAKLREDVDGLRADQTTLAGDVKELEGNPILAWGKWLLVAVGLLGLALLLWVIAASVLRRRDKAEVKKVADGVKVVTAVANEAMKTAQKARSENTAVVAIVAAIEDDVKKLSGRRQVDFPPDFDQKVDDLTDVNPKYHFTVSVEDADPCHLIISLRGDGLYNIDGVKDVTTGVGRKGLKKAILTAASIIDGKSRLVGVEPKSVESLKPAPELLPEQFVLPSTDDIPQFLRKQAA